MFNFLLDPIEQNEFVTESVSDKAQILNTYEPSSLVNNIHEPKVRKSTRPKQAASYLKDLRCSQLPSLGHFISSNSVNSTYPLNTLIFSFII